MELRIKEIESQELNYSRALAAYDQRKHSAFDQFILEESGSKSLPFSCQCLRIKATKRRKRKRIEETTDIASYISRHNAFSYFGGCFTIFLFIWSYSNFLHKDF